MQGAVLKFYWDSILDDTGSTITASSTSSTGDFSLSYLTNNLEVNRWMASSSNSQSITYELSTTKQADYFAIAGHNLNTAGSQITFQVSSSTAFAGEHTNLFIETPTNDKVYLKEFTNPGGYRYWRVALSGHTIAPYISVLSVGTRTELDYITPPFDPYAQEIKANTNMSYGGYITGTHIKYIERQVNITLANKTTAIYNKVKTWWETHQLKNFFVSWDITNDSTNIWLMRADDNFNNPISIDQYRTININLLGRKE